MNEPLNPEVVLLNAAVELTVEARAAFLDAACAGQPELRRKVEELLNAHGQADRFFETSAPVFKTRVLNTAPLTEKSGDRIGRYKLLQQIGEGGCGVVYMAEQDEPVRRKVALKVIKLGMDTKSVIARFEAERQALALMDHPHIAKVLDAGTTQTGRPFFVMELVRGIKITDYCDQHGLPTRERLELFTQVCQAVQHAHQKGIIHRDLKPSNILVTINDGVPVPKVIDFGIAKAATGQPLTDKTLFTAFEQFIGTPAYMSPEQAVMTSLDIDTRSDIYSLGVLLYELLTGEPPFDGGDLMRAGLDEMRRRIREDEPPRPSTRLSTLSMAEATEVSKRFHMPPAQLAAFVRGDLDWIVMKALEKDRSRRYETANGLAMDVRRHLAHEPVAARPASNLYRFQKLVRRHKAAAGAVVAVTTALVVGLSVSTVLFLKERQAHQRAVAAEREQSRLREEAQQARANERTLRVEAESRLKISEAKWLADNGDDTGAEKLINEVSPSINQLNPRTAAILHAKLGDLFGRKGDWDRATEHLRRALSYDPTEWEIYHYLIPALTRRGGAGVQEIREQMWRRFSDTMDARIAECLVKDCWISPWPEGDLKKLGVLADLVADKSINHWARPYFEFAKGLAEYRRGNFEHAIHWMERSLASKRSDRNREVQVYMVMAMAQHHLGRSNESRVTFAKGIDHAEKKLPREQSLLGYTGWNDWIFAHALMDEARTLIERSCSRNHVNVEG